MTFRRTRDIFFFSQEKNLEVLKSNGHLCENRNNRNDKEWHFMNFYQMWYLRQLPLPLCSRKASKSMFVAGTAWWGTPSKFFSQV